MQKILKYIKHIYKNPRKVAFRHENKIILLFYILPIPLFVFGVTKLGTLIYVYGPILGATFPYKIYSNNVRSSEPPRLRHGIVSVGKIQNPFDNFTVFRCRIKILNNAVGRAVIQDYDVDFGVNEVSLRQNKKPGEGTVAVGFPTKDVPDTLEIYDSHIIHLNINGIEYIRDVEITIHEEDMGSISFPVLLSEVSNTWLLQNNWSSEGSPEDEESN